MATWNNTVPQGQTGTGNAVVYGRNSAVGQFGQNLQMLRARQQQEELLRQRQAQELAKSYRDNALSAESGKLWAADLGGIEQKHLDKGRELFQRGIDPYSSFDDESMNYMNERRNIEAQRGYRKAVEDEVNKSITAIRTAKPGEYRTEDIKALNDWIANTKLDDAYSQNQMPPMLRKAFNPIDAVKDVKAITKQEVATVGNQKRDVKVMDRDATEKAIIGRLSGSQEGIEYLDSLTGGISVSEIKKTPPTIEENIQAVIEEYNGDPKFREQLASDAGIISSDDPRFLQLAEGIAKERLGAKQRFETQMENFVANSTSGLDLYDKTTNDFSAENQRIARERLSLARSSEARQLRGEAGSGTPEVGRTVTIPVASGTPNESSVTFTDFKGLDVPPKSMVGIEAFNVSTGKMEPLRDVAGDYSTSGAGVIPNPVKGMPKAGALVKSVDPITGFTTSYIVDINQLPVNLTKQNLSIINQVKEDAKKSTKVTEASTKFKGVPTGGF